jgi:hypothetical protein
MTDDEPARKNEMESGQPTLFALPPQAVEMDSVTGIPDEEGSAPAKPGQPGRSEIEGKQRVVLKVMAAEMRFVTREVGPTLVTYRPTETAESECRQSPREPLQITPLTPLQESGIRLLAEGWRIGEVADELGVHRTTIHRWRLHPAFDKALSNAVAERRAAQEARSEDLFDLAGETLEQILQSGNNRERLAAVRILCRFGAPGHKPNSKKGGRPG